MNAGLYIPIEPEPPQMETTPPRGRMPAQSSLAQGKQYIISIRIMLHMYIVIHVSLGTCMFDIYVYTLFHCLALSTCVTNGQGTIR